MSQIQATLGLGLPPCQGLQGPGFPTLKSGPGCSLGPPCPHLGLLRDLAVGTDLACPPLSCPQNLSCSSCLICGFASASATLTMGPWTQFDSWGLSPD